MISKRKKYFLVLLVLVCTCFVVLRKSENTKKQNNQTKLKYTSKITETKQTQINERNVVEKVDANKDLQKNLENDIKQDDFEKIEPVVKEMYTICSLNLRYEFGMESEIYETVSVNTKLCIVDGFKIGDWVKVIYDKKELYVNSKYLSDKPVKVNQKNDKLIGTFTITHYAEDNVTSTGKKPVVSRTIAVDPKVIPYGSHVVINGHTYVAEDCGGAIKGNRIDIYVGSRSEAFQKGKYKTKVYWK